MALARSAEGVLFGCAAAFALVASAVISGVQRGELQLWIVGGMGFVFAAIAWRLEHRKGAVQIARALDRRLRFSGALFTAFELETRVQSGGSLGALERHVCDRVLERLRPLEAMRAMFPPLVLPIAAPVLAAGFLILTLEDARPQEAVDVDIAALSSGMLGAVGRLGTDALNAREEGMLSVADTEELLAVYNGLKDLDRRLARGRRIDAQDRERALNDLEALEGDLARLVGRLKGDAELQGRLETARNYLEAVRSGLGGGAGEASSGADGTESKQPNRFSPSTEAGREGTILGSSSPTGKPTTPAGPDPVPRALESASEFVGAGRFWPESYDRLISGWVEARARVLEETTE